MKEQTIHNGYFSYLKFGEALIEYYTTVKADEVILFKDGDEIRMLNAAIIENCGENVMYIKPIDSCYLIVIPPGETFNFFSDANRGRFTLPGIQVLGAAGQMLRYHGMYDGGTR